MVLPANAYAYSSTIDPAPILLMVTLFIGCIFWINLNDPFFLGIVNYLLEYGAIDGFKSPILIFSLRNFINFGKRAFNTGIGCKFYGIWGIVKITIDAIMVRSAQPISCDSNANALPWYKTISLRHLSLLSIKKSSHPTVKLGALRCELGAVSNEWWAVNDDIWAMSSHFLTIFGTNGEPITMVFSECHPLERVV